jgi:sugar (pentulose or hexulose) kinase
MNPGPVIAVFDIGKTNKKFFLFDEQYRIVHERSQQFSETTDEDGDACDDLPALTTWVKQSFHEVSSVTQYDIRAVNFSAYGASFVHIDGDGMPVAPIYNYLKPYPAELQRALYDAYGGECEMSVRTASPVLGSLNSGMQLYGIKKMKPHLFNRIKYSLHLPQYLSYLFTGKAYADITSIGCHTGLWDFSKNDYHTWVHREGIDTKLPVVWPCTKTLTTQTAAGDIQCGTGLHDSSAALIPYLFSFTEPFVLISTGTWCISLNPFNHKPLTAVELQQDCLCYLGYDGQPIKASRLFAGYEHELQVKRLAEHFHTTIDYYKEIVFDNSLNSTGRGITFSDTDLSTCNNYVEAYHLLLHDIIRKQKISTSLVLDGTSVKRIFVDGGFANNPLYMHLLAAAFPSHEVFAASVSQATAIGAALCIHEHWNTKPVPGNMVSLKYYPAQPATNH